VTLLANNTDDFAINLVKTTTANAVPTMLRIAINANPSSALGVSNNVRGIFVVNEIIRLAGRVIANESEVISILFT